MLRHDSIEARPAHVSVSRRSDGTWPCKRGHEARRFDFHHSSRRGAADLRLVAALAVFAGVLIAAVLLGRRHWEVLPQVDALLNGIAAVLLVVGYVQIKRGRETSHRNIMLAAFAVSVLFLTCYLTYHAQKLEPTRFPLAGPLRTVYYVILVSHVVLAVTVPPLAGTTIYLGLRDRREKHRKLARWTFPIWLYVSVTGVLVYLMLDLTGAYK